MQFIKLSNCSSELLFKINCPLYTVCLSDRHVLVAGGGGEARTGVQNTIEIYDLAIKGEKCIAKFVTRCDTGHHAVMNCSSFYSFSNNHYILFTGMKEKCQLYKLKLGFKKHHILYSVNKGPEQDVLKNKHFTKQTEDDNNNVISDEVNNTSYQFFEIQPLQSFQTDFHEDPFQKLVKYSPISSIFATAGTDGHVRIWNYPQLNKLHDINAHLNDVDDLDFSPFGDKIITASRDGHCKLWNTKNGMLLKDFRDVIQNVLCKNYICRSCRFSLIDNDENNVVLYISMNPVFPKESKSPCFLSKWNGINFSMTNVVSVGTEKLSSMAVSDNGYFVGLGTQVGSVKVYDLDLELVYYCKRAHSIFVTGLEFLKTHEVSRQIASKHEASLISISVDNEVNIHHVSRSSQRITFDFLFFIAIHFILFFLMDCLNL